MSASSFTDTFYAIRFLKLLVTDWEDTEAFKLGLIDDKGKKLRRPVGDEKDAYTIFHRLVFNIKRLLPRQAMASKLSSYAAAVYLVKEHYNVSDDDLFTIIDHATEGFEEDAITESWFAPRDHLLPGTYTLTNTIAHPTTLEMIGNVGSEVLVSESVEPVDTIFGSYIYPVKHINTNQTIYVTIGDLTR